MRYLVLILTIFLVNTGVVSASGFLPLRDLRPLKQVSGFQKPQLPKSPQHPHYYVNPKVEDEQPNDSGQGSLPPTTIPPDDKENPPSLSSGFPGGGGSWRSSPPPYLHTLKLQGMFLAMASDWLLVRNPIGLYKAGDLIQAINDGTGTGGQWFSKHHFSFAPNEIIPD